MVFMFLVGIHSMPFASHAVHPLVINNHQLFNSCPLREVGQSRHPWWLSCFLGTPQPTQPIDPMCPHHSEGPVPSCSSRGETSVTLHPQSEIGTTVGPQRLFFQKNGSFSWTQRRTGFEVWIHLDCEWLLSKKMCGFSQPWLLRGSSISYPSSGP